MFPKEEIPLFLLLLLVVLCFSQNHHSWSGQDGGKNVTCIAHDAKFTCDCQSTAKTLTLPHLIGGVYQVEVINCQSLIVYANTLEETQGLRRINFRNVQNLELHQQALAFSRYASNTPLIIEFENVHFTLIDSHAINGNIEEISFISCRIDMIKPFGFTTLKDRAVLFKVDGVHFKRLEPQSFKKFAIEDMQIKNCVFSEPMASKVFYEIEVLNSLQIINNEFKKVHSRAFSFKMVSKLTISSNTFEETDAEWIEAHIRASIALKENNFSNTSSIAFKGIQVHRDYQRSEPLEFYFSNNTVRCSQAIQPLEFNEKFQMNIKNLNYDNVYECQNLDRTHNPPMPTSTFFRNNIDNIYFINPSAQNNQRFLGLSKVIDSSCQQKSYMIYIIVGVSLLVVLIVVVVVIICVIRAKRKKNLRKLDIIQPEPRTYTQTQIVYQIENAGLLKTDL